MTKIKLIVVHFHNCCSFITKQEIRKFRILRRINFKNINIKKLNIIFIKYLYKNINSSNNLLEKKWLNIKVIIKLTN